MMVIHEHVTASSLHTQLVKKYKIILQALGVVQASGAINRRKRALKWVFVFKIRVNFFLADFRAFFLLFTASVWWRKPEPPLVPWVLIVSSLSTFQSFLKKTKFVYIKFLFIHCSTPLMSGPSETNLYGSYGKINLTVNYF